MDREGRELTLDGREGAHRRGAGMGMSGISKSKVSRLCSEIADKVRPSSIAQSRAICPYLWIDATYVKVRQNGRIVAVRVNSAGAR